MLKLFRETYTSLRDNLYGRTIIARPLKFALWYLTAYLLLIAAVYVIFGLLFMTYLLPQVPKFITTNFPDSTVAVKDGILSSTIPQPYVAGNSDFSFILDTLATPSALGVYRSGILLTRDQLVIKAEDGSLTAQSLGFVPSFSTSLPGLADYITSNYPRVWLAAALVIISVTLLFTSLIWGQKFISFLIWSAVFYLITRYLLKRTLDYLSVLRLVIYASVFPLLLTVVLSPAPGPLGDIINLGLLAYFTFNWIRNLDQPVVSAPPPTRSVSSRRRRSRA